MNADRRLILHRPVPGPRTLLTGLLALAAAGSVVTVLPREGLLHGGGTVAVRALATSLLTPDVSGSFLVIVLEAATLSAAYAIAAMSVAVVIGLPGALVVSGTLVRNRRLMRTTSAAARTAFAVLRAAHELVWALLLVSALGLTPLAGILAIGIPYGAIIARVLGERLQEVPPGPLAALRSAGASASQELLYGRLPAIAADGVAYLSYRLECAVRAAAVLSFVGLGGIGYRIQIALADLRFEQVWTLLAALVVLIVLIDTVTGHLRGRLAV